MQHTHTHILYQWFSISWWHNSARVCIRVISFALSRVEAPQQPGREGRIVSCVKRSVLSIKHARLTHHEWVRSNHLSSHTSWTSYSSSTFVTLQHIMCSSKIHVGRKKGGFAGNENRMEQTKPSTSGCVRRNASQGPNFTNNKLTKL